MGANAQTTVPTFTAGQVLTADQQNQSARTGVPVFSTTGTRDAGFGGTGEKTLAEGQLCYVEGTGLQSYNGTSWVTWGTAPSAGGLELISSTTIGTTVASVTVSSAFSSTYDNYEIIVSGGVASTTLELSMTLGSTTTGYYFAGYYTQGGYGSTLTGYALANTTKWPIGNGNTNSLFGSARIIGPNLAKRTSFSAHYSGAVTTGEGAYNYSGFLNDATQYTAFTLTATTGTLTGGTIKVYGWKN